MDGLALDATMVVLALFVAAEFAFVKIRSTEVDHLVQEGRTIARLVKEPPGGSTRTSRCANSGSRSPR